MHDFTQFVLEPIKETVKALWIWQKWGVQGGQLKDFKIGILRNARANGDYTRGIKRRYIDQPGHSTSPLKTRNMVRFYEFEKVAKNFSHVIP